MIAAATMWDRKTRGPKSPSQRGPRGRASVHTRRPRETPSPGIVAMHFRLSADFGDAAAPRQHAPRPLDAAAGPLPPSPCSLCRGQPRPNKTLDALEEGCRAASPGGGGRQDRLMPLAAAASTSSLESVSKGLALQGALTARSQGLGNCARVLSVSAHVKNLTLDRSHVLERVGCTLAPMLWGTMTRGRQAPCLASAAEQACSSISVRRRNHVLPSELHA